MKHRLATCCEIMGVYPCHGQPLMQANEWRLCRADSRGVMELPPGDTKCLVYVNGPAAAIGVLSASGFAGVTSGIG